MKNKTLKILGINFFKGNSHEVIERLKSGGLLVVPAAPALITIKTDRDYYQSLIEADVVIPDSGYMVLIWNIFNKQKLSRISGLKFLREFLADEKVKQESNILLVDPRQKEAKANLTYLKNLNFKVGNDASYIAPMYNKAKIKDEALLALIEQRKPKYVIINLGGGVQEKLGAYLKKNLSYKPAIICTGAAIAFLTGEQADIPNWADKMFLGWLFRCIEKPSLYLPRYFKAFKLASFMLQHRENAPV
jgi:N-acetylglucosaminyldiphosphoundecaprenol N-acetyl-beta-D-mannosaminyltransferase